jgi:hypothetical protein
MRFLPRAVGVGGMKIGFAGFGSINNLASNASIKDSMELDLRNKELLLEFLVRDNMVGKLSMNPINKLLLALSVELSSWAHVSLSLKVFTR